MAEIQFPYAYDENNELIFIDDVTGEMRQVHEYHCPNCGAKMLARLGKKNAHCFAHAGGESCSKESYLHKVAKDIIVKKFMSGSFPIRRKMLLTCDVKCEYDSCSKYETRDFDLVENYDLPPKVEESFMVDDTRFVPDVSFVSSDERFKPVCIEIFYKHSCSEKKLKLCDNVIEIRVKQFSDLMKLEKAVLCEEIVYESPETYQADFINFDKQLLVSPEKFRSKHPRCMWTQKEIKKHEAEEKRWRRELELDTSDWSRLYWFSSGKTHYEKILEEERFVHHKSSVFELTMQHVGDHQDDWLYLLDRASEIFPTLRSCKRCFHHEISDWSNVEWCGIRKNGSSRKGTFDQNKAGKCSFYVNMFDAGPAVYLWKNGWSDDYYEIYPERKKEEQ